MVYQAQSPDDLHLLVRMQEAFDELDCNVTYEQSVEISEAQVQVSAVCYEAEDSVRLFTRSIDLEQRIDPAASTYTWENDGKVHLKLRKGDAPSYWPTLIRESEDEKDRQLSLFDRKIAMWKAMHNKYIEQVEDYMDMQGSSAGAGGRAASDEL